MKFPPWIKVFGDTTYRNKKCPSEGAEQITFFNYIRKLEPTAVHIKNEGKRTYSQVSAEKAQGMTPGAPDIIIPGCPTATIFKSSPGKRRVCLRCTGP